MGTCYNFLGNERHHTQIKMIIKYQYTLKVLKILIASINIPKINENFSLVKCFIVKGFLHLFNFKAVHLLSIVYDKTIVLKTYYSITNQCAQLIAFYTGCPRPEFTERKGYNSETKHF